MRNEDDMAPSCGDMISSVKESSFLCFQNANKTFNTPQSVFQQFPSLTRSLAAISLVSFLQATRTGIYSKSGTYFTPSK